MSETKTTSNTRSIVVIAAVVVVLVIAALVVFGNALFSGGAKPAADEFYSAPADLPAEHGQIIRAESITTGVPDGADGWRILYTTTNADGTPAISSGVVLAPTNRDGSALPVITVGHGTTGVAAKCAPSLSKTPFYDGAALSLIELVINYGAVAVISDYTGLGAEGTAAYLVGDAEGRNVLDAALALQQLDGVSALSETMIWGYSQGGQASLWAGQMAAQYAPELNVLGVAAFAPATDVYGVLEGNRTNGSGQTLAAYVVATWNNAFPQLDIASAFEPEAFAAMQQAASHCIAESGGIERALNSGNVPAPILSDDVLAGDFGAALKAQTPTGPWTAPVLVAQGVDDQLVFAELQEAWVASQCAAGNVIDFRTYAGRDHLTLTANDSPLSVQLGQWTIERLTGTPAPTECTTQQF